MTYEDLPLRLSNQEVARRLIRSRNWHLFQAARCRQWRLDLVDEEIDHDQAADRLEAEIRALGFDPQPPMGPRAA